MRLTVDLPRRQVRACTGRRVRFGFEIDAFRKHCLLNGLDDIGLTLQETDAIRAFEHATGSSAVAVRDARQFDFKIQLHETRLNDE
jgi:3-isopropylmalate/(R)-2-methylmalate dehydratase small subunit